MENRRLFIALDQKGLKLLLKIVQHLVTSEDERCSLEQKEEWISVLIYPSYMECFDVEELSDVFFEWTRKCDVLNEELLVTLQKISGNVDCDNPVSTTNDNDNKDDEYLSTSLHELADKLPVPGLPLLEIYVLGGEENFKQANLPLLASLKRFEYSYQAYFALLSEAYCDNKKSHIVWTNYIDFNIITVEQLFFHLKLNPLWAGTLNVKLQQCNGDIPLQYYFMYEAEQSLPNTSMFSSMNSEHRNIVYDTKIEIVSTVRREALPLHLINPHKFTLHTFSPTKDEGFNFFNSSDEDKLFLGILKYGESSGSNKFKTSDWISHVTDPFTHYLGPLNNENIFCSHHAILIEYDKLGETIVLYFFFDPKNVNVKGFLRLLKSELAYVSNDMINESKENNDCNVTFYKNGADIIPSWEWCEKNSWHEEENSCKVVKSISRLKSDDFFIQGVMIPGIEPLNNHKNNTEHELLDTILTMFDKTGQALTSNLNPIPVIEDRLLKNIKCEESLVDMDYSVAKKVIGHGLDYCIDSLGSMHLSDRLTKVQKRFVPQDTINITTGNLTMNEESAVVAAKKNILRNSKVVPVPVVPTHKHNIKKKESRAEKHKRRLKTIVEGTVAKYGQISQRHGCYKQCCKALFDTCVSLVKELKSSKDLNNQMKVFAKMHVNKVVATVLAQHSNT